MKHSHGDEVAVQHVMVHIDASLGPIGAWSYEDGTLLHFYLESLDPAIPARAREVMAVRDLGISVPEWFTFLAGQDPTLLDEYHCLQNDDDVTLPYLLADFRRRWSTIA